MTSRAALYHLTWRLSPFWISEKSGRKLMYYRPRRLSDSHTMEAQPIMRRETRSTAVTPTGLCPAVQRAETLVTPLFSEIDLRRFSEHRPARIIFSIPQHRCWIRILRFTALDFRRKDDGRKQFGHLYLFTLHHRNWWVVGPQPGTCLW